MKDRIAPRRPWLDVAAVALLFSATLFFFTPAHVYLNNAFDFSYTFEEVLPLLLALTLVAFLLLGAGLAFLFRTEAGRGRATALLLALGVALWLQGNVLAWNMGSLAGKDIDWGGIALLAMLDGAIWLGLIVLSQWRPAFFLRVARGVSFALLLMQLLLTFFYWSRQPDLSDFKKYAISNQNRFVFSAEKNVIILLLDNFQSDLFQELVDADPKLGRIFTGFTYFRNNLGGFPVTYGSIPLILTGQYYDNRQPVQDFLRRAYQSPSSIPKTLKDRGFASDFFPGQWWPNTRMQYLEPGVFSNLKGRIPLIRKKSQVAFLYDLALFRALPLLFKRMVYNHQQWTLKNLFQNDEPAPRPASVAKAKTGHGIVPVQPGAKTWKRPRGLARLRRRLPRGTSPVPDVSFMASFLTVAKVTDAGPVFKFYHMRGIHDPFRMDEKFMPAHLPSTRPGWRRIALGELKLVDIFLTGLRKLEVFDNTLIFVIADHGHPHGVYGRVLPPGLAAGQAAEIPAPLQKVLPGAIPLLLVKDIGAPDAAMTVSDAPVSLQDIAATVFDRMGIRGDFPGRSLFSVGANESRPRKFYYYNWDFKNWDNQFMPDLNEFEVTGHSWLAPSWRASGRILRPAR